MLVYCLSISVTLISLRTAHGVVIRGGSRIPRRRGRQLSKGAPTCKFAKFSEKLHEIEKILGLQIRCATPKSNTGNGITMILSAYFDVSPFVQLFVIFHFYDPGIQIGTFNNFSRVCLLYCLSFCLCVYLLVCLSVSVCVCLCVHSGYNFWTIKGRSFIFSTHIHLCNI